MGGGSFQGGNLTAEQQILQPESIPSVLGCASPAAPWLSCFLFPCLTSFQQLGWKREFPLGTIPFLFSPLFSAVAAFP